MTDIFDQIAEIITRRTEQLKTEIIEAENLLSGNKSELGRLLAIMRMVSGEGEGKAPPQNTKLQNTKLQNTKLQNTKPRNRYNATRLPPRWQRAVDHFTRSPEPFSRGDVKSWYLGNVSADISPKSLTVEVSIMLRNLTAKGHIVRLGRDRWGVKPQSRTDQTRLPPRYREFLNRFGDREKVGHQEVVNWYGGNAKGGISPKSLRMGVSEMVRKLVKKGLLAPEGEGFYRFVR